MLGFIPRVLEYSTYDQHVLSRDLLRIERSLRARGYYEAKVVAARVIRVNDHKVHVEIEVAEGEPVRVARISPGIASLPPDAMRAANLARKMADGDVLDEERFEKDREAIERALRDLGYAFAKVDGRVEVDIPSHSAQIAYVIDAGARARYGPITVIGLNEIPEGPVHENLGLREGEYYSESDLDDARQALIALGVFANVDIIVDRSKPETAIVPISVRVNETALRSLRVGGGVAFDVLRLFVRLDTGWEHRNFLGGMRRLSLDARPGVTLYPTRVDHIVPPNRLLLENRLGVELRQPSFLEGRTTGAVSAQYNVYPMLYRLPEGTSPESEPIIGYHEVKASARMQRAFFSHHLDLIPSYNWQTNVPLNYQGGHEKTATEDCAGSGCLDTIHVSYPELAATLTIVDNPLSPRLGFALSSSFQVAGHIFGGNVSDVRIAPSFKFFLPVKRAVLAGRLGTGFLIPRGYGERAYNDVDPMEPDGSELKIADQQKLLFRAFYSGGPNSNRGYPYQAVGPHGPIGFLVPTGVKCEMNATTDVDPACIRPLGGLTLWEASLELRIPFSADSPLWAVVFVDASDVTKDYVAQIRFNVPHLSPGLGVRYQTPVGPIRFDIGYRLPGAQSIGTAYDETEYGVPGDPLLGFFPGTISLAIGEAF